MTNQATETPATRVKFIDLRIISEHTSLKCFRYSTPLKLEADSINVAYKWTQSLTAFRIEYQLRAKDSQGNAVLECNLVFLVLVEGLVDDKRLEGFAAEDVLRFADSYLREHLHTRTSQMNIPPLVLEVYKPALSIGA